MSRNDLSALNIMRTNAEKGAIIQKCVALKQILQNIPGTAARKAHLLQYCRDNSSTHAEYLFLKKQMFSIFTFNDDNEGEI